MFNTIFFFELKRLLKSVSTYIYFCILFLVTFFMSLFIGGAFSGVVVNLAGEKINANSPIVIDAFFAGISGWVGIIIVVAIIGNAVLKDFKYNVHNLIFTTPVGKFDYLFGRFAASLLICLLVLTGPAFGMMLAYASPWVNADKIGAFMLSPYVACYWQTVVPNALLQGAIFFAVSLIARDIFVIWLSLIIFYVGIGISNSFFNSLQFQTLSALADPFGAHAKRELGKYWTTFDKNHLVYRLTGIFLWNRILWLGASVAIFLLGYARFSFSSAPRRLSFGRARFSGDKGLANFEQFRTQKISLPAVSQTFSTGSFLRNLRSLSVYECRTLLRNVYFRIILLFGMLLLFLTSLQLGKIYDTVTLPVTYQVVEIFGGTFQLFIVIMTIFFGGEIVWRNRDNRIDNILDALPVPNWVFYISKLAGLMFMQAILVFIIMFCGVVVQLFKGYTNFEILLYIKYLFGMRLVDIWMLAILTVFVQAVVRNKYVGYFIVALFYIWNSGFAGLVLKHNLLVFGSDPGFTYSDMNGFGHEVFPYYVFKLYWGAFCFCLAMLSNLLWARGSDAGYKWRIRQAGKPAARRSVLALVAGIAVFIVCGSFIYYNTNVENHFETGYQAEEDQAHYERTYKKYENYPQPKITAVALNVDIYPYSRSLHAAGTYMLLNKSGRPVDSLFIELPPEITVAEMHFGKQAQLALNDTEYNFRIYKLAQPLAPGDSVLMTFDLNRINRGFQHDFTGLGTPLYNGTFMNNTSFLPHIGYAKEAEIQDNATRKKHGLAYRPTANPITDTAAYTTNIFTSDADFIRFEATVSTVPDQIAVAPGYLQKEWTANGRRYFTYKMDSPIMNFYSFLSARYTIKKEEWNGIPLEIYYNKGHEYNLDRMFAAMKDALQYYSSSFAPYQHKQVRILEFPRYATFAQSFPNTIPFSEGIGFIADVDTADKSTVDYPYYVTAHEVAHQWFAHQVVGADVAGSNMLSETLAQYGAITVMEHKYGPERLAKFLKIEMDKYLMSRSSETEKEQPLATVDAGQGYILYQKGGIVMTGLRRMIGEDKINGALRNFLDRYAFKAPPYPTTADLIARIDSVTPDSLKYMITDGFKRIVVYENKVADAGYDNASHTLSTTLNISKLVADGAGKETQTDCNDYVQVAIYKDRSTVSQLLTVKVHNGDNKLSIPIAARPYRVVLDPNLVLINKKPDGNELRLDASEKVSKK